MTSRYSGDWLWAVGWILSPVLHMSVRGDMPPVSLTVIIVRLQGGIWDRLVIHGVSHRQMACRQEGREDGTQLCDTGDHGEGLCSVRSMDWLSLLQVTQETMRRSADEQSHGHALASWKMLCR